MDIPNYKNKSPVEIAEINFFDSASYFYRGMAWLDYHNRTHKFSSLLYACAEARHGIEYLLFEELVISTGANLSVEEYQKCVKKKNRFTKTIKRLTPIWIKITSGQSGMMHPKDMNPIVREIWEQFRTNQIDTTQAKFQLNFLKPLAMMKKPLSN